MLAILFSTLLMCDFIQNVAQLGPLLSQCGLPTIVKLAKVDSESRAVRLIEIENKIAIWDCAISKSLYSSIFFCAPTSRSMLSEPIRMQQNRPGIQTDSMLKKQGRWVQNRIRTWWPKKCMLHAEHTARSYFLQSGERFSEDPAPLAHTLSALW